MKRAEEELDSSEASGGEWGGVWRKKATKAKPFTPISLFIDGKD